MCFDPECFVTKRGTWAEVQHAAMRPTWRLDANRVNALRGEELARAGKREIDRGKAQPPSPRSTRDDSAADRIGTAERVGGTVEITASDRSADRGRRDRPAITDRNW